MGVIADELKDRFQSGVELGADEGKTPGEAFDEVMKNAQREINEAQDLTKRQKARKKAVAERLNQLRKSKGLYQKEVASRIGVNVITLSGYEIGKSEPPLEVLVRLADLYSVSLDYLMCRTDAKIEYDGKEYQVIDADSRALKMRIDELQKELDAIRNELK